MMKRLLALVLALTLCLASAAVAEENAVVLDPPQGSRYGYAELAFSIIIPEGMEQSMPGDEDAAYGAFDMFVSADETRYIQLRHQELPESFDMEQYLAQLSANEGVTDLSVGSINGITWILYNTVADQAIGVTLVSPTQALTVIAAPASDADFMPTFAQVLGSIEAYQE